MASWWVNTYNIISKGSSLAEVKLHKKYKERDSLGQTYDLSYGQALAYLEFGRKGFEYVVSTVTD